jgi:hypothetical protein
MDANQIVATSSQNWEGKKRKRKKKKKKEGT